MRSSAAALPDSQRMRARADRLSDRARTYRRRAQRLRDTGTVELDEETA